MLDGDSDRGNSARGEGLAWSLELESHLGIRGSLSVEGCRVRPGQRCPHWLEQRGRGGHLQVLGKA